MARQGSFAIRLTDGWRLQISRLRFGWFWLGALGKQVYCNMTTTLYRAIFVQGDSLESQITGTVFVKKSSDVLLQASLLGPTGVVRWHGDRLGVTRANEMSLVNALQAAASKDDFHRFEETFTQFSQRNTSLRIPKQPQLFSGRRMAGTVLSLDSRVGRTLVDVGVDVGVEVTLTLSEEVSPGTRVAGVVEGEMDSLTLDGGVVDVVSCWSTAEGRHLASSYREVPSTLEEYHDTAGRITLQVSTDERERFEGDSGLALDSDVIADAEMLQFLKWCEETGLSPSVD